MVRDKLIRVQILPLIGDQHTIAHILRMTLKESDFLFTYRFPHRVRDERVRPEGIFDFFEPNEGERRLKVMKHIAGVVLESWRVWTSEAENNLAQGRPPERVVYDIALEYPDPDGSHRQTALEVFEALIMWHEAFRDTRGMGRLIRSGFVQRADLFVLAVRQDRGSYLSLPRDEWERVLAFLEETTREALFGSRRQ
ncbi:hypothetical protein FVE67_08615 [Thermosulfurimonas marina]|uniref:Uncharacterized protein n=1 Tax=Thermosulfurimonas marina TaxID=2047767 RepID=A0A6H1WUE9_9BACT|nr:hypothetical protein [Thermosulfurimonas marina]QJA06845.1 hypothetical protein FVE67_08615 [Thermosulfurimonas marina]